jgi:Tfp pilus assembly protein PilN
VKPVNLIPQDQRRGRPSDSGGRGAPIALGVLAALLVMVVVYVLTANSVTDTKDKTQAASAEADKLEAQASQQNSYANFAQIAATRTLSVSQVAATRFDWERFMRELAHIMPDGSWLQSADASVTGETGSASASTPSTPTPAAGVAAVVQPAANLIGCTPDQDDVAGLMVRLGELHRVDDVTLNESTAGEPDQEVSLANCGGLYTFNITVKFSATEPSHEAPLGTKGVPASLGGGS